MVSVNSRKNYSLLISHFWIVSLALWSMGPASVVVSSREKAKGLQIHLAWSLLFLCCTCMSARTQGCTDHQSGLLLFDFKSVRLCELQICRVLSYFRAQCWLLGNTNADAAPLVLLVLPEVGKQLENSGWLYASKDLAVEYLLVLYRKLKFSMYHEIVQFGSRLFFQSWEL